MASDIEGIDMQSGVRSGRAIARFLSARLSTWLAIITASRGWLKCSHEIHETSVPRIEFEILRT
jgi:hypothetical protein